MLSKELLRLACFLFIAVALAARAQDSVTPTPSPPKRSVRISFLPPPLDGTISLGIYDAKGKLIRVLHREADVNDFTIGNDALLTTWDGKDDSGENVPPGKYSAHGFAVGNINSKTIGFFFNDFVTNADSPRVRHLKSVRIQENELRLEADLLGDERAILVLDPKQGTFLRKLPLESLSHCEEQSAPPQILQVIDCDVGMNNTLWLIDGLDGGRREIKQLSPSREVLHRISILENQPQPQAIAASTIEDRIFLLEESPDLSVNRLRAVSLTESKTDATPGELSDLKTDLEKKIIEHRDFSLENGKPIPNNPKNKIPSERVSMKLQPNPLLDDARVTVELGIGLNQEGSFLRTSDGLPLRRISATPRLVRSILIAHGSSIDVFQDDGAVVAQVQLTGPDQMMGFDCGGLN